MKKRHIVITAVVTFYVTALLFLIVGVRLYMGGVFLGNDFQSKLQKIDFMLKSKYIFDYDQAKLEEGALEGYLKACGDVYTEYISKAEYPTYKASSTGKYKGIGVVVSLDGDFVKVISVNPESPASKAGIIPDDIIKEVNGVTVNAESYNDAISIIRGEDDRGKDDKLSIIVMRYGEDISLDITREEVESITVEEKLLDGNIGYIRISSFEGMTAEQLEKALDNLNINTLTGLIFDMRNNPGGTLESVLKVSDRVLSEGIILTIKDKAGNEEVFKAEDDKSINLPICVLANSNSASAAEVFSAALKENGVATLVGETTFGKGIVQSIYELGDETAVKLTTAEYYTPNGTSIHKVGIKPDFEVKLDETHQNVLISDIPYNEDLQLKKAVEVLNQK